MIVRLHHLTPIPHVPDNRQRVAEYHARRALHEPMPNTYPWKWTRGERYARDAMADVGPESMGYAQRRGT